MSDQVTTGQSESDTAALTLIEALEAEMVSTGKDRGTPIRAVMALLGDRCTTLILLVLATHEWRSAELRRVLARISAEQSISQRVLTLKLRTLERDGFVTRRTTDDVPPKVSYALTPLGMELQNRARDLIEWVKSSTAEIKAHRMLWDAGDTVD